MVVPFGVTMGEAWWSKGEAVHPISHVFQRGLLCAAMAVFSGMVPLSAAWATDEAGARYATVMRLRGDVTATSTQGGQTKERKLRVGDPVHVGEQVRAASQGEAVLKADDGGLVAIRPKAEFVTERFAADDKPTDGFVVRLLSGSLRLISGWTAQTNRPGHKVVTPTGTVGIRGTDHEPYVLSADMAAATSSREGTYDKVNRGGTTLEVEDGAVDIEPGKVGFARAAKKSGVKERGLLTLLLPVLLDRVPAFYVPGAFDAELDRLSATAEQDALRLLEQKRQGAGAVPAATSDCSAGATATAKLWIGQLDSAIAGKNAAGIMALFAPNATIRATVRTGEGKSATLDLDREDLAQSTVAAFKGLTDYQQRRVTIDGKPLPTQGPGCTRIAVTSVAIEQGVQSGKPYRFESTEQYVLDQVNGKWLATKAETTQK
jgi:hypothetical protein